MSLITTTTTVGDIDEDAVVWQKEEQDCLDTTHATQSLNLNENNINTGTTYMGTSSDDDSSPRVVVKNCGWVGEYSAPHTWAVREARGGTPISQKHIYSFNF